MPKMPKVSQGDKISLLCNGYGYINPVPILFKTGKN
jgi:hypothetical protein